MVVATAVAQRTFQTIGIHSPHLNPIDQIKAGLAKNKQLINESKLKGLNSNTLNQLHQSFFDAAKTTGIQTQKGQLPAFMGLSPSEALAASMAGGQKGFFSPALEYEPPLEAKAKSFSRQEPVRTRTYGAQSRTPGLFSNPVAERAADAARQSQVQTQKFLANQLGQSFAAGNMSEFLGPNACFEDVLATVMMGIAEKSEREMMDQIRVVERGEAGLNGFIANRAKDLGGIAGGALGGYFAGAQGAAIGQDVGERLVGNYSGQYGGSSRQIQFERLKMMIHKQSEMMSAISNILATIHSTNKNTISNIRG